MSNRLDQAGASAELFRPDLQRVRVAVHALWEIESLARTIGQRSDELEASQLWIRGIAARLCNLASAGMSVLDDELPQALTVAEKLLAPWEGSRAEG